MQLRSCPRSECGRMRLVICGVRRNGISSGKGRNCREIFTCTFKLENVVLKYTNSDAMCTINRPLAKWQICVLTTQVRRL